jgi:hypothetical protein
MGKTAVEWLEEKLIDAGLQFTKGEALEINQAKEMEKQQIIEAHAVGRIKECSGINTDGENYYNEQFKNK